MTEELKTVITFGKHKGKTLDEISNIEPSYICWLKKNVKTIKISKSLVEACERDVREREDLIDDMYSAMEGYYQGY